MIFSHFLANLQPRFKSSKLGSPELFRYIYDSRLLFFIASLLLLYDFRSEITVRGAALMSCCVAICMHLLSQEFSALAAAQNYD